MTEADAFEKSEGVMEKIVNARKNYDLQKFWLPFQILGFILGASFAFGIPLLLWELQRPSSGSPLDAFLFGGVGGAIFGISMVVGAYLCKNPSEVLSEYKLICYLKGMTLLEKQGSVAILLGHSHLYALELDALISTQYSPHEDIQPILKDHAQRVLGRENELLREKAEKERVRNLKESLFSEASDSLNTETNYLPLKPKN